MHTVLHEKEELDQNRQEVEVIVVTERVASMSNFNRGKILASFWHRNDTGTGLSYAITPSGNLRGCSGWRQGTGTHLSTF